MRLTIQYKFCLELIEIRVLIILLMFISYCFRILLLLEFKYWQRTCDSSMCRGGGNCLHQVICLVVCHQ